MTMYDANTDACKTLATDTSLLDTHSALQPKLSFRVQGETLEFSYRPWPVTEAATVRHLPAPALEVLEGGMIDPSLDKAFVRVAPYPQMKCGDKLVLNWCGLDADGLSYESVTSRFVSAAQVGHEVVFVIKGVHIAMLERGSVEIHWTLFSVNLPEPISSDRLQLNVGDPEPDLLAPLIEETVGGTLDPARVEKGTNVIVRPYARMAVGDRILLGWQGAKSEETFSDELMVEAFAVREELSFWITHEHLASHTGQTVSLSYQVISAEGELRQSAILRILIAPLVRGELAAPQVLDAEGGELDVADSIDGVTVVIVDAQAEEGELVYLRCDGEYFNHRDDRDITRETAGEPLVFIVPHRFWREHRETVVQVSYTVERLDDVSQASSATRIRVRA
ncbi:MULTISPECIES: hypothetical protein [Pseudomonas]|jgi:hypothetical protein|uniref:Uncharacterized protein n=1 Tax=Pseudomonas fluorescens TaxID=294 RepID=A0A5E7MFZ3_PSEFL|nr:MULTISPECIES: hypothetical protein [Pseudomonas]VVP23688.1 hypothetical protein PS896_03979 [Pseudomonas fluorescens]